MDVIDEKQGLTYRKLDYWTRKGFLRPVQEAPGPGYPRSWSPDELRVARLMGRLVAAGMSPEVAHRVARAGGRCEIAPGITVVVEE